MQVQGQPQNDGLPLRLGDGLIGKVAASGECMLLDDLEHKNVRVRSGLIERMPRALSIFPVQRDKRVVGVLELLFLDGSAATAREFLEFLGEEIARTARARRERGSCQSAGRGARDREHAARAHVRGAASARTSGSCSCWRRSVIAEGDMC